MSDEASSPDARTQRRLRFDMRVNPVKSELELPAETEVSFVSMDAVGTLGGLRLDDIRLLADVYDGYTYFRDGDVCVAKITPCFENGKGALASGLANGVAFGTTELHVLRPGPTLDAKFLFYLLMSHEFRSRGESEMLGAGGQKRVPETFLKDWRPTLPPLEEQRRITQLLDEKTARIDALIEKKRALLDRLAEKRQALVTQSVTKGLNSDALMKPSGIDWLGEIPSHWEIKRLRYTVKGIEQGWSPQCENRPAEKGEWGVLKVGCVNGEFYDESENKALPPELGPVEGYEVRPGDILVSRANTRELLGSAAIVEDTQGRIILCDKLYRLNPDENINRHFLTWCLRSSVSRFQYEREATGTSGSMQNIGQDTLKNLFIALPPAGEQKQIVAATYQRLASQAKIAKTIETSIAKLHELRAAIITSAVTGTLNLSAERQCV